MSGPETPRQADVTQPGEFSRLVDIRALPAEAITLEASEAEREAIARRFEVLAVHTLSAEITLVPQGSDIAASGRLQAIVSQTCAVSGDELAVRIDEPLDLRFVPERVITQEEIELDAAELDEISYRGTAFDLGEAVAQSLALAIDPYATGPAAEEVRREVGLSPPETISPFAALAALKKN